MNFLKCIQIKIAVLLISSDALYGMYEAYEEDVELSRRHTLISRIGIDEIIAKDNSAITVCTTTLSNTFFSYDHVSLVFETKHPTKIDEVWLISIHFGGDGHSSSAESGRPIIDNTRDTLKKVYRGKKAFIKGTEKVQAIYSKRIAFVVKHDDAMNAIRKCENDTNLKYNLFGWKLDGNTFNCITYANRVLKDAGVDINFDNNTVSNAGPFIDQCKSYIPKENQKVLRFTWSDLDVIDPKLFHTVIPSHYNHRIDECLDQAPETKRLHILPQENKKTPLQVLEKGVGDQYVNLVSEDFVKPDAIQTSNQDNTIDK